MTEQELARLIAYLEHLKVPFDRKQIGKIPASNERPELDFVNHAHVTNRLNQAAPGWMYSVDETFSQGGAFWLRGTMTISGASRVEYGTGKNPLEATSHFIRRAAMRFGVATDLWAKEDFERPAEPATGEGAANSAGEPSEEGGFTLSAPAGRASSDEGEGEAQPASESTGTAPPPPPLEMKVAEPHEHVPGKQLASGKRLCTWQDSTGKVCGDPFKPEAAA